MQFTFGSIQETDHLLQMEIVLGHGQLRLFEIPCLWIVITTRRAATSTDRPDPPQGLTLNPPPQTLKRIPRNERGIYQALCTLLRDFLGRIAVGPGTSREAPGLRPARSYPRRCSPNVDNLALRDEPGLPPSPARPQANVSVIEVGIEPLIQEPDLL